ncbi:hypothetical protein [Microbacterium luteum]|uniref:hypothetical protein n=1 Tax=Microbacterium luteum TaxID=2782167 RepID=UPI001887B48C|nr:hypothetical protein [Microbacterium luteum]
MMRVEYDRVVFVKHLLRPISTPRLERADGWAVRLEDQWFWFSTLEPASTFGRSGRKSIQVRNWDLVRAVTEARFDDELHREVFTLYVLDERGAARRALEDRELMRRERDEPDIRSSHWNP